MQPSSSLDCIVAFIQLDGVVVRIVAALVAATTVCAAPTGAEPDPSSPGPQNRPPIQFQLQYPGVLRDADLPNPAARVTVAGKSVWLLFDTGAGVHMLASWFVEAAGLPTGDLEGMSGQDSTGRPLRFRAVRNVPLKFGDGGELALPEAAVTEFPSFFKEHEVVGVLSPQLLSPAGRAAVLDLRVPELRIEGFDAAVRRLHAVELRRGPAAKVCSEAAPLRNRLFAIPVSIGSERASLALDSGAAHSKLSTTSPAARGLEASLEDGGTSTGLSGVADAVKIARRVRVRLGKHAATVDLRVGSNSNTCAPDGILGLDVMGSCAFVLAEQRIAFACGTR